MPGSRTRCCPITRGTTARRSKRSAPSAPRDSKATEPMSAAPRRLYRRADLSRVLDPATIAIVGASPRPGSFGERLQKNLQDYEGRVFLVNAKYEEIDGARCYPSLGALPQVPDCVAVTVPRESAEPIVQEAGELGAGGVILYASGYSETGIAERIEQQGKLGRLAQR